MTSEYSKLDVWMNWKEQQAIETERRRVGPFNAPEVGQRFNIGIGDARNHYKGHIILEVVGVLTMTETGCVVGIRMQRVNKSKPGLDQSRNARFYFAIGEYFRQRSEGTLAPRF